MESRKLTATDVLLCLNQFPEIAAGLDKVSARRVLTDLAGRSAFAGVLVERRKPNHTPQLIACAASVFVGDEFAVDELENPRPGMTERILRSHLNGQSVVLSHEEIGRMNGSIGLSSATIWARWLEAEPLESIDQVHIEFTKWYIWLHRGQFFRRMMFEIRDARDLYNAEVTGSCKILGFDGYNPNHPLRGLAFIDRSTAPHLPTTAMGRIFNQHAPELGLRSEDQELLLALAEEDLLDDELAHKLNISVSAVKRRWAALYSRIELRRPDFFYNASSGVDRRARQAKAELHLQRDVNTRGSEKRRKVLRYVEEHPEELRPFHRASQVTGKQPMISAGSYRRSRNNPAMRNA